MFAPLFYAKEESFLFFFKLEVFRKVTERCGFHAYVIGYSWGLFRNYSAVRKSFLGTELQFCAEQTAVHSGENWSFVRRNYLKISLFFSIGS